jgi:hypothetical protein
MKVLKIIGYGYFYGCLAILFLPLYLFLFGLGLLPGAACKMRCPDSMADRLGLWGWALTAACLTLLPLLVMVIKNRNLDNSAPSERRTLTALHKLGGTYLVWDVYGDCGGALAIRELHIEDRAGKPMAIGRADPICQEGAFVLANRYSKEPGHYVLALPSGTVISAPSRTYEPEPQPTPPQAPLPAQPERTPSRLGQAASVLEVLARGHCGGRRDDGARDALRRSRDRISRPGRAASAAAAPRR